MDEIDRVRPALAGLASRLAGLRRDAAAVLGGFLGPRPPPFTVRAPLARHRSTPLRSPDALLAYRRLRVTRVVRETPDAVSLHLSDPAGAPIDFVPGQFLTLHVTLPGGASLKRAYSLSSMPASGAGAAAVRVTIKRVAGGAVSNHLNDHAAEGDVLDVLGPSGHFGISPAEAAGKHLLLIGGGSGVTPLRPVLEARLADSTVTATLLYGNRSEQDILFKGELDAIARAFAGRCAVRHVLQAPPSGWQGGTGMLDRATAAREIEAILSSDLALGRTTEVLVCGPTPMMSAVRDALVGLGVPPDRVREEQFSSPDQRRAPALTAAQPVTFKVRGLTKEVVAAPGQTLLEAGLSAGLPMPFSCTLGGCGACKLRLVSGRVVAEEPNCLSAEEAKAGHVLACVSRAAAPTTVELS